MPHAVVGILAVIVAGFNYLMHRSEGMQAAVSICCMLFSLPAPNKNATTEATPGKEGSITT